MTDFETAKAQCLQLGETPESFDKNVGWIVHMAGLEFEAAHMTWAALQLSRLLQDARDLKEVLATPPPPVRVTLSADVHDSDTGWRTVFKSPGYLKQSRDIRLKPGVTKAHPVVAKFIHEDRVAWYGQIYDFYTTPLNGSTLVLHLERAVDSSG